MNNSVCPLSVKIPATLLLVGALSMVAGCSTLKQMGNVNNSADASISPEDIAAYANHQDEVYLALLKLAGLPDQPATTEDWNQFIMAGVQYSDQKCENYLDAINWVKQGRERDSNLMGQTGALTNSIMGIAKASSRELALTAAAFGYTRAGFDTLNTDALAGLEASTTRNLVHNMQHQYLEHLNTNQYTHRVGAFNALQGYIRLCMPGNIAAEANNAVRTSKPVSKSNDGGVNVAPYISLDTDAR